MASRGVNNPIDRMMERASRALEKTDYFLAERLSWEALLKAHGMLDFERMGRIVLPLLEARRQKRQLAEDLAGGSAGHATIVDDPAFVEAEPETGGCFLFQPPLIAADARNYREVADAVDVPVFVLTREPLTRDGLWPIVSVASISIRTKVEPPHWPGAEVQRVEKGPTRDNIRPQTHTIPMPWFEAAAEELGDAAIARVDPDEPAAWQVEDLLSCIEALPYHEKLHQRLEDACVAAAREGLPSERRRSDGDPYCF